ncbi:NAD(P)-dependent oxidoreductase [Sandaracinus amylolyticus]|nr:NAD(P)-binding oxidoreductase [Sandaracinus amylolyticus]
MKVLVLGATGGSGRAAVDALLRAGHEVTAFVRKPELLEARPGLHVVVGDATRAEDVERAVAGHDAVIVTLGIRENAVMVRLRGSAGTPIDVRSVGTANVIAAMRAHGVRRLVVQTTYGVGETRNALRWIDAMLFRVLLRDQIADTEEQERAVRASGLDWVLVQPVHLTDADREETVFASARGEARKMTISRRSVGKFLAERAAGGASRESIALSTA